MVWAASATRSLAAFAGEHLPYFSRHIEVAKTLPKPILKEYERVTRTRITGRKASGFFLLEQNQTVNRRCALIIVGLIVLCAIALDETRIGKSAGKRPTCPSYESNERTLKRGLVCGRIDSLDHKLRQLRPPKRFSTARASNLRDDTDRLAIEAKAAQRLINYANKNQDGDDLKDAADDSQDDADESEDTSGDSQDGADDCVE